MIQQQDVPEGYATIRRSKGRVEKKFRTSSASSNDNQIEMIEMSNRHNSMNHQFETEILFHKVNIDDDAFDETCDVDEGVLNDLDDGYCDNKRSTFETFKPRNSVGSDESDKDFHSLPYDIIMSPLKSPQYINQLNAMRSKTTTNEGSKQQNSFYSRPESPKYGKLLYNRSTSPSADSMDNSSSNSSTYSTHYHTAFKHTAMSQSLHLPHPQHQNHDNSVGDDGDNVIIINVQNNVQKPPKATNLNYRKSFSYTSNTIQLNHNEKWIPGKGKETRVSLNSSTMTKSLHNPLTSTSQLNRRRFATMAHPKDRQIIDDANVSTISLNDRMSMLQWDPILSCKIGSQTTLRTKPPVPWYELACKKEFRQSCPPLQVIIK